MGHWYFLISIKKKHDVETKFNLHYLEMWMLKEKFEMEWVDGVERVRDYIGSGRYMETVKRDKRNTFLTTTFKR